MRRLASIAGAGAACLFLAGCATPSHETAAERGYTPIHAGYYPAANPGRHAARFSQNDWEGKPDDVPLWSSDPKKMTVLREMSSKER